MGVVVSSKLPYASVEVAKKAGKTQAEIDAWLAANRTSTPAACAASAATSATEAKRVLNNDINDIKEIQLDDSKGSNGFNGSKLVRARARFPCP